MLISNSACTSQCPSMSDADITTVTAPPVPLLLNIVFLKIHEKASFCMLKEKLLFSAQERYATIDEKKDLGYSTYFNVLYFPWDQDLLLNYPTLLHQLS